MHIDVHKAYKEWACERCGQRIEPGIRYVLTHRPLPTRQADSYNRVRRYHPRCFLQFLELDA